MKKSLVVLSLILAIANGCGPNLRNASGDYEDAVDRVFSEYDDINKPGAAVAVVKDGKIVFKKGYGAANLEYDIPVTTSTIFHIASVSKQFTAFSVLLLAEDGKLAFDDDIRKYIPEVPDFGKTITLRHLASHTSGLRDQWNLLAMAGWRLDDVITKEQVLKLVAAQKELNFEPGEEYVYCNTGFTLLAEVVSRVSGQTFAEFTRERIFDPLGMSNTLFYDDHEKIVKNRAYSYYANDGTFKKSVLSYANVGATSLFTTVEDLSLWAMNFQEAEVGNSSIMEQMNTLARLNNGETFGGAYGQFFNEYKGKRQIQHSGGDAGFRSYLGRFPDQGIAVSVFSNYGGSNPIALALSVADIFLEDEVAESPAVGEREEATFIELSAEILEEFTGFYWNEEGAYSRKIFLKNDTLIYSRGGKDETLLAPINENTFQMLNIGADVKIAFRIEGGQKSMIVTIENTDTIIHEAYTPATYSARELEEYTGIFYSEELSTAYEIFVKDELLVAKHSRLSDIEISPVKKDEFSGNQWFFSQISFERNRENSISGMRVSSGRVRNLYFEKKLKNE